MHQYTCQIATPSFIPAMHLVRMSVKENALSNPKLVTEQDYLEMLEHKGRGWVCFDAGVLLGFAIVDLQEQNIWALFVAPEAEAQGIGRQLHDLMVNWSFSQANIESLWLNTAPGTRAERFYQIAGWKPVGFTQNGEIRFEMQRPFWETAKKTDEEQPY